MSLHHENCRNCAAPLTGEYCASCGQREGRADLYFGEAVGDILGEVLRWDSRLWRTLASLLLRPGFLSAEFNVGRRIRYMPPFRLYLVLSFVTFLVVSFTTDEVLVTSDPLEDSATPTASVTTTQRDESTEHGEESVAQGEETPTEDDGKQVLSLSVGEDAPEWVKDLELRVNTNAARAGEEPDEFFKTLLDYLPQMLFLMLPVFALMLRVLYAFSAFHYLQHLVFALHYHSFLFLLYLASTAGEKLSLKLNVVFALLLAAYLPLALKRCYAKSWPATLWRAFVLGSSYSLLIVLGFASVVVIVLAVM